ncbi:MAG: NAD(P)-dependent oxidoreductase [Chloroflexi bacterium]|nr:NAD(P)-dependent oxidoreductase [Chloroflexota bacterium]
MKVLILGGNGMLGPWVVKSLEGRHELRITDINDLDTPHEYVKLDVSSLDGVVRAAEGMDAIINLSVLRPHRQIAFDVNTRGNYNMAIAARTHGIRRLINTGPHYQLAGPNYEEFNFDLNPDMPPQPGTRLYAHTKALGQEILRVFSETDDIYVQTLLFYNFYDAETLSAPSGGPRLGTDLTPFSVAWTDAGEAIRAALEIELADLPTRCETYNVFTDLPHGKFSNQKARRQLNWQPRHFLEGVWTRPFPPGE